MNETLYRLVYVSRNEIHGPPDDVQQEIESILSVAREKNAAAGVTGALMFHAECFAQVLEGTEPAISSTFERIQTDDRHSRVELLTFEPTDERIFDLWSMAYVGTDSRATAQFAEIASSSGFDSSRLDGDHVFEMLRLHLRDSEAHRA